MLAWSVTTNNHVPGTSNQSLTFDVGMICSIKCYSSSVATIKHLQVIKVQWWKQNSSLRHDKINYYKSGDALIQFNAHVVGMICDNKHLQVMSVWIAETVTAYDCSWSTGKSQVTILKPVSHKNNYTKLVHWLWDLCKSRICAGTIFKQFLVVSFSKLKGCVMFQFRVHDFASL